MSIISIRDFVPLADKSLTDIELVDKYIHMFTGASDKVVDLRCLDFSLSNVGSGSAGTLYKANTANWYFKLSQFSEYNPDECYYESVCEVIGSRVADLLHFNNTQYKICHALVSLSGVDYTLYLCVSPNYKKIGEHRTTLENLIKLEGYRTTDLMFNFNFCKDKSYFESLCEMVLLDYIVDNRDRHGANIELLISDSIRLSPIYDTGYSLLSPMQYDVDKFNKFNPSHSGPVNNFLISRNWEEVLHALKGYITVPDVYLSDLRLNDLEPCFKVEGSTILKYTCAMIRGRYLHAKEVLNS